MKMHFLLAFTPLAFLIASSTGLDDALDNGNFLLQMKGKALPFLRPYAPVFYARVATLLANAAYDAITPYHVSAKGIYSEIVKRPEEERTMRNKNIAIAYACMRMLNNLLPGERYIWEQELRNAGLDPLDMSLDLNTPQGIGNHVGESVLNNRLNDGMNQEGNTKYNRERYFNSISYRPKNSAYKMRSPDNWQPLIEKIDYGLFASQVHVVPQLGIVKPYALKNVDAYEAPVPVKSFVSNMDGYVDQVQEILRESYTLDDRKKMAAEYFDNKVWSLDGSLEAIMEKTAFNLDEYVFLQLAVKIALFDASIVSWKEKLRYDSVRPINAIRYLYENVTLKAWGGIGVGPVDDIKGREWQSYMITPAHSEYPSGSTCFCSAQAQVLERYFNSKYLNLTMEFPQGSSRREPWITPSKDVRLVFNTVDDFVQICGLSRLYAGVHFLTAINEAVKLCQPVGDEAYDYVKSLTNGVDNRFFNKKNL